MFDELFDAFFSVDDGDRRARAPRHDHDHDHDHDEPVPPLHVKASEDPPDFDDPSHSHEQPADVAKYFEDDQLATAKRMHKDGTRIDLAGLSQELMLGRAQGRDRRGSRPAAPRPAPAPADESRTPGELALDGGQIVEADLSVGSFDHLPAMPPGSMLDEAQVQELRRQVDGAIANLPDLLRRYLEKLMALERRPSRPEPTRTYTNASPRTSVTRWTRC